MNVMNIFQAIPARIADELSETLLTSPSVRIERIVSRGHTSPDGFWYEQCEHEWVLVIAGAGRLRFEDQRDAVVLAAGDYIHIPAQTRHRVEWTSPDEDTIWLAVFYR